MSSTDHDHDFDGSWGGAISGEALVDQSYVRVQRSSFNDVLVNTITATLGAGILSLPWSGAGASVALLVPTTAMVLGLNYWVSCIIIDACDTHKVYDLGALVRLLKFRWGGKTGENITNASVWLTMLCSLTSYYIICADALKDLVTADAWDLGRLDVRFVTMLIFSFVFLPVCYLPPKYLSFTSVLSIAVNVYIFALVVVDAVSKRAWTLPRHGPGGAPLWTDPTCLLGVGPGVITFLATLSTAVLIQMCLPPMFKDMEDRVSGSPISGRCASEFKRAVKYAFVVVFFLLSAFSVVCLYAYGTKIEPNILSSLPRDDEAMATGGAVARVLMLVCMLGVFPLMLMPMVAPIYDHSKRSGHMATCGIVAMVMLMATGFDNLGTLNVWNGAISLFFFGSGIPGLVGLYAFETITPQKRTAMWLVICVGGFVALLSCFFLEPLTGDEVCWVEFGPFVQHHHHHHHHPDVIHTTLQ